LSLFRGGMGVLWFMVWFLELEFWEIRAIV
jgi:hypothetical protein